MSTGAFPRQELWGYLKGRDATAGSFSVTSGDLMESLGRKATQSGLEKLPGGDCDLLGTDWLNIEQDVMWNPAKEQH